MELDTLTLARIQFGFTISFHIIFPAITIGLASYMAVLEGLWLKTANTVYRDLYHFWLRVFAINFGMGVVSGLVMAYQFGTNWSYFSDFAGGVTGPLLTYEVLTAFFLEAGFLGVMMFGWHRVGPRLHWCSTIFVAIGTLISATWILASNSWMQTPQGYEIINSRVVPTDWFAVIFNPSFPYRLIHMVIAAFLTTALIVGGVAAWHMLRRNMQPSVRKMYSMAMWMLIVVAPIQIFVGDLHGLNTLKHQPAKLAAMEGHWENGPPGEGVPLVLFGWPDMEREETRFKVEVPRVGSMILTHSLDGTIPGLKEFAPEDRPNSTIVFWTFRIMVGLGMLMLLLGALALYARWKGRLYTSPMLHRFSMYMGTSGVIALLAGWYTTEIGRQPWVVYNVMRTADAVTPHSALELTITLILFIVVYFVLFGAGIVYMLHIMAQGPQPTTHLEIGGGGPGESRTPARPLSAATDADEEPNTSEQGDRHGN